MLEQEKNVCDGTTKNTTNKGAAFSCLYLRHFNTFTIDFNHISPRMICRESETKLFPNHWCVSRCHGLCENNFRRLR